MRLDHNKTWPKSSVINGLELGWHNNLCVKCIRPRTVDGHDPCIANLPEVNFACCGHGVEKLGAYVSYENGLCIHMNEVAPEYYEVSTITIHK